MWTSICRQCAITSHVGHAFTIVLIHQKMCVDDNEESEEWESVTAERGHWATLHSNLEVLVHLSNVVGLEALKRLPPVPFDDIPEDSNKSCYAIEPAQLKLKFFDKGLSAIYILAL